MGMNISNLVKRILFCLHTFGVRLSTMDVLDPDNKLGSGSGKIQTRSGPGALGLTGDA